MKKLLAVILVLGLFLAVGCGENTYIEGQDNYADNGENIIEEDFQGHGGSMDSDCVFGGLNDMVVYSNTTCTMDAWDSNNACPTSGIRNITVQAGATLRIRGCNVTAVNVLNYGGEVNLAGRKVQSGSYPYYYYYYFYTTLNVSNHIVLDGTTSDTAILKIGLSKLYFTSTFSEITLKDNVKIESVSVDGTYSSYMQPGGTAGHWGGIRGQSGADDIDLNLNYVTFKKAIYGIDIYGSIVEYKGVDIDVSNLTFENVQEPIRLGYITSCDLADCNSTHTFQNISIKNTDSNFFANESTTGEPGIYLRLSLYNTTITRIELDNLSDSNSTVYAANRGIYLHSIRAELDFSDIEITKSGDGASTGSAIYLNALYDDVTLTDTKIMDSGNTSTSSIGLYINEAGTSKTVTLNGLDISKDYGMALSAYSGSSTNSITIKASGTTGFNKVYVNNETCATPVLGTGGNWSSITLGTSGYGLNIYGVCANQHPYMYIVGLFDSSTISATDNHIADFLDSDHDPTDSGMGRIGIYYTEGTTLSNIPTNTFGLPAMELQTDTCAGMCQL
jgi:hypothetical protein